MSPENLEQLHRTGIEIWNTRDLESGLTLIAEDVEISTAIGGMEGGYHGHEGIRRWWADFHAMFPDCSVDVLSLRTVGDTTLAQIRLTGHGGEIGAPLDTTMWQAWRWRDGRIWRIADRLSESETLAAVGISE
jgi:ketosteroid isomerase-like protein